jgi:outer membrane phospholipase A
MRSIILILLIFIGLSVYAKETKQYDIPLQPYKQSYFIAGDDKDQIKLQLSMQFNVFYPDSTGLFFGYTQMSNWIVYDNRDTFYTMYQPEFFYKFESNNNIFNNFTIPFVDYIQISPIYHCSTGVEGPDQRSINTYYGQIQLSHGEVHNIGLNVKVFNYYTISNRNYDINLYKRNYEASAFFKIRSKTVEYLDKEEIRISWGGNPFGNGYYILEAQVRIISTYVQPKFFVQWFSGYGEFMVNYKKRDNAVRLGLILH